MISPSFRACALILLAASACGPNPSPDGGFRCHADSDCSVGDACDVATGVCSAAADSGPSPDAGFDAGPADSGCWPPTDGGYVAPAGGTQPTFTSIYNTVIDGPSGCGLCHEASLEGQLIMLTKAQTYEGLVNHPVESMDWAGTGYTTRVIPGDPTHSALVAAVEHSMSIPMTLYMPQNGAGQAVSAQQIDAIVGWIQNCAPNN